jgi:hypothetical protein
MLEARLQNKKCTKSRIIVFMIDTGAPFTIISSSARNLLFRDCKMEETILQKTRILIN